MDITYRGERFIIRHLIPALGVIANLGWTHAAAVTRPNGTKQYYANLIIENDTVLHAIVIK